MKIQKLTTKVQLYTQMSPPVTKFVIKILFSQLRTIIKSFHEGEKGERKTNGKYETIHKNNPDCDIA